MPRKKGDGNPDWIARKKVTDTLPTDTVIAELASKGVTQQEMADFLQIDRRTLMTHFAEAIKQGQADIKIKLRMKQLEVALGDGENKPNTQLLIHLGKHYLGQKDEIKFEPADDHLKEIDTHDLIELIKSKTGKQKQIKDLK